MRIHDSVSEPIWYRDLHTDFFSVNYPKSFFVLPQVKTSGKFVLLNEAWENKSAYFQKLYHINRVLIKTQFSTGCIIRTTECVYTQENALNQARSSQIQLKYSSFKYCTIKVSKHDRAVVILKYYVVEDVDYIVISKY